MFLGLGVGRVFSGAVLPMFLLYDLVFRSRKCLEKIFFWSGPLFGKIFGSELLFYGVVVGLVCFGAVLPICFCFINCFSAPETVLKKILLMSGLVFLGCLLSSFGFFADVVVFFVFVSFF